MNGTFPVRMSIKKMNEPFPHVHPSPVQDCSVVKKHRPLKATHCARLSLTFCVERDRPRLSLGVTFRIDDTWPVGRPTVGLSRCCAVNPHHPGHMAQKMRRLATLQIPSRNPKRREAPICGKVVILRAPPKLRSGKLTNLQNLAVRQQIKHLLNNGISSHRPPK